MDKIAIKARLSSSTMEAAYGIRNAILLSLIFWLLLFTLAG